MVVEAYPGPKYLGAVDPETHLPIGFAGPHVRMTEGRGGSTHGLEPSELLQVRFESPADGWLGLELSADNSKIVEAFSHIYPALSDLCSALCDVLNGVTARTVVFLLEPAELELHLVAIDKDTVRLSTTVFPDRHRVREGTVLLEHCTTARIVVLTFWRALRRLQASLPEDEFEHRFRQPFPALEMASLTNLLALGKDHCEAR